MFASDDPPKKLTFLRKKQRDPMKIKPLPDASNHVSFPDILESIILQHQLIY